MSVEKYLVDEVFADAESPDPDGDFAVEQLLRAVLPRILAMHRADVLRDLHAELTRAVDESYAGGRYLTAKRLLRRVALEVRFADEAVSP